jgi:two-component SAPR family response regulator
VCSSDLQVSDIVPKPFTPEAIRQAILKITGEVA